jgi:hypothetical protein
MIEIDSETDSYSVEFGQGEQISLSLIYTIFKQITDSIEDGSFLKNPQITAQHKEP